MLVAQGVPLGTQQPISDLAWRLGHLSVVMGVLGGDGAPACAANFSEQNDFAEVILIPLGG